MNNFKKSDAYDLYLQNTISNGSTLALGYPVFKQDPKFESNLPGSMRYNPILKLLIYNDYNCIETKYFHMFLKTLFLIICVFCMFVSFKQII